MTRHSLQATTAGTLADRIADARRRSGSLLLALDFDGTLAPIVPRPSEATVLPGTADTLRELAARPDTAVALVSGRGVEDLRARVREDGLYFAGNHGFEIEGPDLHHRLPEAERLRPEVAAVAKALRERLPAEDGFEVEEKGVTLSVHYRRATAPDAKSRADGTVDDVLAGHDELRATHGKRVVEVRPALDWHKGRALEFLLDSLHPQTPPAVVFIGDDVTDEDGFRAARARGGLGVLVSDDAARATDAELRIDSLDTLADALRRLAGARAGEVAR